MGEFLVIAVCLALNSVLAAYEMAFVSVSRPELRRLARQGIKEAQRLVLLRESPERTLSIIQIGITLVGVISAAVGGAGAVESIVPYLQMRLGLGETSAEFVAIFVVVFPITYLSVLVGELVPKTLALRNPVKIALKGARLLLWFDRALSPAVTVLEWSTKKMLQMFFPRAKAVAPIIESTVEIDSLAQHHQEAVLNLARIERKPVKEILVPWRDVIFVTASATMEEVAARVLASGHTRLPVVDTYGYVLGVLNGKEFLAFRETGSRDWLSIIRKIVTIKETDSALSVLRLMQRRHSHMALVISQTSTRIGIITMEDITEEVWGEFFDEDDDGRIRKVFAEKAKSSGLLEKQ